MDKYCRLCLSGIHPHYTRSPEFGLLIDLSLMYFGVKLNSILPAYVCKICETKVLSFHEFQQEVSRCQEMLLYELQIEENMVNVSDGSTDETADEFENLDNDPFGLLGDVLMSDNSMTSEFLNDLFEKDELFMNETTKDHSQDKKRPYRAIICSYPEPSVFTCDLCDAKLLKKSTLKTHMLRHIPPANDIICDICPYQKTFTNIFGLRRHKMYYHSINPKKYFRTCDQCNRTFKNQNLLNCHKRYDHTIKKQLKCNECGKVFKNKITLGNHIKKLHNIDRIQFGCDFCNKAFSRKDALLEHQTVHSGDRPYKCLWCPKTFRNTSHFSTHRTTVHTAEYLKWKRERYK